MGIMASPASAPASPIAEAVVPSAPTSPVVSEAAGAVVPHMASGMAANLGATPYGEVALCKVLADSLEALMPAALAQGFTRETFMLSMAHMQRKKAGGQLE